MPNLYDDDFPARRILARTLRDHDYLPAVSDPVATAEAILLRVPRDIGVGPLEAVRRMLDEECRRAAARLTPAELNRVKDFANHVGFDFRGRP